MGHYNVAQVCLNGHAITAYAGTTPSNLKKHCPDCGAKTIMNCPSCNAPIEGAYEAENVISFFEYRPPAYCKECGEPLPWTKDRIVAAVQLLAEEPALKDVGQASLQQTVTDVMTEKPATKIAVVRLRKLLSVAGKQTVEGIRELLVDLVSESVKKAIWG